jgi:hypothetical protein
MPLTPGDPSSIVGSHRSMPERAVGTLRSGKRVSERA